MEVVWCFWDIVGGAVFQSEEIGARERWWGLFGDWYSIYPLLFFALTFWIPFPLALALHFPPPNPHSSFPTFLPTLSPFHPVNPQPPFPSRLSSSSHPPKPSQTPSTKIKKRSDTESDIENLRLDQGDHYFRTQIGTKLSNNFGFAKRKSWPLGWAMKG